ncbi:response regulator [Ciceribacter sp. L1K22]|uniref:response regulator n=1 Tax=Ciceribacter sp. L1K22 TaxID=2820275 RepID=UPI001ABDD82B|nr:response regulator [Ciceribacter sp. L1K22]MBO3758853.1 response regulator [Ciceribacter sp. L1K22]
MAILIIEDNATNAMVLKHLAKKVTTDDIVIEADPVRALELCHHTRFRLLIVDHVLPGMNGIQFTKAVRMMERYDDVPMIMVTADSEPGLRHAAIEAGVTDFLTKPVEAIAFRTLLFTHYGRADAALAG